MGERALAWLRQAERDLVWGKDSLQQGHYAQTRFIAQQVAEKVMKASAYASDIDLVRGHSLLKLAKELHLEEPVQHAARKLDLYYLATRYPDALPDHQIPSDAFDQTQAQEALGLAEDIFTRLKPEIIS